MRRSLVDYTDLTNRPDRVYNESKVQSLEAALAEATEDNQSILDLNRDVIRAELLMGRGVVGYWYRVKGVGISRKKCFFFFGTASRMRRNFEFRQHSAKFRKIRRLPAEFRQKLVMH